MQDYERKSVYEIINLINSHYFLPDIQRNFVWKPEQVYQLFDSVMRDYPISTFLFWKQNGSYLKKENIKKLEFVRNSKDKNKENTEINQSKEYFLVLDGQQRLTTFYLVLKGNYIIRNNPYDLYYDILSGEEEKEDGNLFDFKFFNVNKGASFLEKDENKIWYRVKDIYDINVGQIFSELNEISRNVNSKYKVEISDSQKNNIAKLCSYLKSEKIIYYYPEVEKDYDKVLDIFVRTNSGGTKLSYSDLLFSTIKSKWSDSRAKFESLLTSINDNERFKFTNDFILKTSLVIYATNNDEVRYKTNNFKSDLLSNLKKEWKNIESSIKLCIDLIKDKLYLTSYKTITSNNALIPIIYWIYKNNLKGFGDTKNCITDENIIQIRIWLIKALLSGIFGGQSDTILYKCKEIIKNDKSKLFPSAQIEQKIKKETKRNMDIDPDFLDSIKYGSADSYLVLSICYKGAVNFNPRMKGNLPEQDHIVSKSLLKKSGIPDDEINCIYNIRLIGSTENKTKSSNIFSINDKNELKKHMIPEGDWKVENYNEFVNTRKKLLRNAFNYK